MVTPCNSFLAHITAVVLLVCSSSTGCNDDDDGASSIAKALEYESKERKLAKELDAKRKAELKAKAEEKKRKQQAIEAELENIVTLPPDMPKTLKTACDRVVEAYDEFMKDIPEREALEWFDDHLKKLGRRRVNCMTQDSIEAAACQAHALQQASADIKDQGKDGARELMLACAEKYGATLPGEAAADSPEQ